MILEISNDTLSAQVSHTRPEAGAGNLQIQHLQREPSKGIVAFLPLLDILPDGDLLLERFLGLLLLLLLPLRLALLLVLGSRVVVVGGGGRSRRRSWGRGVGSLSLAASSGNGGRGS